MTAAFQAGDCVIYRKQKHLLHPSQQARGIYPAPHGDYYSYCVDKFWRVIGVQPDRTVVVCTRQGKQRAVAADDPALRRATWWQRFLFRHRFPSLTPAESGRPSQGIATS